MHFAWMVAKEGMDPADVTPYDGVPIAIDWVAGGLAGALAMVAGYGLVYCPSLSSLHVLGLAIDAIFTWDGTIDVIDGMTGLVSLTSTGGDQHSNAGLVALGKSYGVVKLASDPPHWSSTGH